MERILTTSEIEEHKRAMEQMVSAGSRKIGGVNVVPMWLGGKWILRRDGKVIPEVGPVIDFLKERHLQATYEEAGKYPVMTHQAYGHRLLEETKGAVCPVEVVEDLIRIERSRIWDTHVNKVDQINLEKRQDDREAQIRAKNPAGMAWDADEKPAKTKKTA